MIRDCKYLNKIIKDVKGIQEEVKVILVSRILAEEYDTIAMAVFDKVIWAGINLLLADGIIDEVDVGNGILHKQVIGLLEENYTDNLYIGDKVKELRKYEKNGCIGKDNIKVEDLIFNAVQVFRFGVKILGEIISLLETMECIVDGVRYSDIEE